MLTEEFIVELVRSATGGRSWDDDPKAGIEVANGFLTVTQTKSVHEEIRGLLARLGGVR